LINPDSAEDKKEEVLDESCIDAGQKSYYDYEQEPGGGKKRIGQILSLEEGIYSLLFVANFSRVFLAKALADAASDLDDSAELYDPSTTGV